MQDITIRPAAVDDLPRILALLTGARLVTAGARDHLDTFLVAVEGDNIAGTAGLEMFGDVALLRSVAVSSPFRGRGLGQRLVHEALTAARRRGVRQVALLTEGATPFFTRLGFQEVDRSRLDHRLFTSKEFADPCCATAVAMKLDIGEEPDIRPARMSGPATTSAPGGTHD
jgi:amino-acid N-acetyltransferase